MHYNPRRPEQSALRQILAENLSKTRSELAEEDVYLPRFVWRELEAIIDCGVVDKGFVRVVCGACKHERIVGFSCKGRAVCSSCVGRKMNELSLHLFDHVVPDVPLRQFVLTLPVPLRILVARDKRLLSAVRTVFLRAIKSFVCKKARDAYPAKRFLPAGFCVVQRFGSALQLAPHFHAVLFDGAYRKDDDKLCFVAAPALTPKERLALVTRVASRIERLLARRGLREPGDAEPTQLELLAMKVPASLPALDAAPNASAVRGFNLHASTRISASDDSGRLRLFRYVLRPAIATDRLCFDGERVTFQMKRTFSDGTRLLHFTPQSFIRRIAMLVPAPRQHEITYTGLLAANAKHRRDIVRVPTHRRVARVPGTTTVADESSHAKDTALEEPPVAPRVTLSWAELLKKTFAVDVLRCERCDGRARVVAAITERAVIDRILTHLRARPGNGNATPRAPPAQQVQLPLSLLS